jgi:STE24 endopeptidase
MPARSSWAPSRLLAAPPIGKKTRYDPPVQFLLFGSAILVTAVQVLLTALNLSHLRRHGDQVPRALAGEIDPATLEKSARYTLDRSRVQLVAMLARRTLMLLALFGGLLGAYDRFVQGLTSSFVLGSVLYFLGLAALGGLFSLPFGLYQTFVIEARHGFNRMTPKMWLGDLAKGVLLSALFLALCAGAGAWLVLASPRLYWVWVWAGLLVLGVLITLLAPHVIEPLFFRVTPLAMAELEPRIRALAERAGVHVKRVFQIDASRRSSHSNAYFTGLGPVKRVVLFDTLLARMTPDEILGVLAHELGHWKRQHILQRFVVGQLLTLGVCYAAFRLLAWDALPSLIGENGGSFFLRATLVAFVLSLLEFPTTPLWSAWSRRHEWQADEFACDLTGNPAALASGLAKLARDNLSNLHPHPLFAAFYASHPTMPERVERLRSEALA